MLAAYYQSLHPKQGPSKAPDAVQLLDILAEMFEVFDQVLMAVDGLDECGPQCSVTDIFSSFVHKTPSISLASFSCADQYIQLPLEVLTHIEIAAQSADVELYVRAELRERIQKGKPHIQRKSLEEEIVQVLIDGAQGMLPIENLLLKLSKGAVFHYDVLVTLVPEHNTLKVECLEYFFAEIFPKVILSS